jgi:acyl transferase domain-containing protein
VTERVNGDTERLQKALSAIQRLRSRVDELERSRTQPIAILGMGCRFPSAPDPAAYWRLLCAGESGIRDLPEDRWPADGTADGHRGGFLDDVAAFDAPFFGISPREARCLDPQQRLLLEVSWEALESAAVDPRSLEGSRTGVFVGIAESEYLQLMQRHGDHAVEIYDLTGNAASVASGRLSYRLGLQGPSLAIDTACSSSLVAVHLAVASLRAGESDLALAGGVSVLLSPDSFVAFSSAGALAADGHCKAFDAAADGYSRGEGCGIVVLKRLADALADGDPILAVIRGSAVNQDGRTNGLTAPNGLAQQAVLRQALAASGLAPSDVDYLETHGTGTPLGDSIEAGALGAVFQGRDEPLVLGAAKTNIGHLEAAAGIAGLIKAVLVLQHGEIPPNLHFHRPNPHIAWDELPVTVPTVRLSRPGLRTAGVSSFGFSGTNAHVILERLERAPEPAAQPVREDDSERPAHVLALSARSPEALRELAGRYAQALTGDPELRLADVCFTANTGRSRFEHRLGVVATTSAECAERLAAFAGGQRTSHLVEGHAVEPPKIAFLFTGQGSQYAGMGRQLYLGHPGFRRTIDRCDEVLRDGGFLDKPLLEVLYPPEDGSTAGLIDRTVYAQPALFAVELALAELWRSWGVEPQVLLGHSTGEYVAACVAGVFSLEDGLTLIARRAQLIEEATSAGATAAVLAEADRVAETIAPFAGQVSVSAINGPRETLIAGAAEAVEAARAVLASQGMDSRTLKIPHAPHCPLIDPVLDQFEELAGGIHFAPPRIRVLSNLTGQPVDRLDARYWRRHMREPVRFADGIASLASEGCRVMLEVGPQPILQLLGRQSWTGPRVAWLSSLWALHDDWSRLLQCVADLHVHGAEIDWVALDGGSARRKVALPTYPFQRTRHWFAMKEPEAVPQQHVASAGERRAQLREELKARVAAGLEMDPSRVDAHATFIEMGADSLLVARVVQDVQDLYGVSLSIGRLFEDLDTIELLAAHLDDRLPAGQAASPTTTPEAVAAPPAPPAAGDDGLPRLMATQLEIIARQLEILSGHGAPRRAAAPSEPKPAAPVSPAPAARELDPVQRQHLEDLIARYTARTATSQRRGHALRRRRVDTRLRSVRPETLALAYPIIGERAEGARFHDVDGNEYVDIAMGIGALLCGHYPSFLSTAIAEQLERGIQTGPVSELGDEVAAQVCEMTGTERVLFAVTGTCAVRGALRIAQAATGRSRFVMFSGSYHGQDDRVLAVPDVQGDHPRRTLPMVSGVSPGMVADTLVLPYDDPRSLEVIKAHARELAAVLVEPVQSRNPALQPKAFLRELRQLTSSLDVPLVFDEIITGFRIHPGGAQAWSGVQADLAVYGKCVGGGFPVSLVAGKAALLDRVDGGDWLAAPDAQPDVERTFIGSTYEMHPVAMAATRAMLHHLRAQGPALQERLNASTAELAATLNALFAAEDVPIRVVYFGSIFRFAWKGNTSYTYQPLEIEIFHLLLIERGLYVWEGRTCFLSTAHTRADLDALVRAVEDAIAALRAGGFLPQTPPARAAAAAPVRKVPASEEQKALWELQRHDEDGAPHWSVAEHLLLRGPFDLAACRRAVRSLVQRHEALRTVFDATGATQEILPDLDVDIALVDLSHLKPYEWDERDERGGAVDRWLASELEKPFDLARGPLLRVSALRLREDLHHLLLTMHHILSDGWSMSVLLAELGTLYSAACRGADAALPPPLQYHDFVRWQTEQKNSAPMASHRAWWLDRFADGFPPMTLPTDRPRPDHPSHRGARCSLRIEADLCRAIKEAGRAHQCTLFMTLLAAYGLLVHRLTGLEDVVLGTPTAGRSFKGGETIVGYCTHVLPIRSRITAATTVSEYLRQTRETVLAAFEHQDFPFARLRAALDPEEMSDPLPLQAVFNLDRSIPCPAFQGLEGAFRPIPARVALVDFRLDAIEIDGGLWLDCDYRTDLLDDATARAWCEEYRLLLAEMARDPRRPFAELPCDRSHWMKEPVEGRT